MRRTTPADVGLIARPALAPHLQAHAIGENQMLLVSEAFNTLLHGALHCDLLPLLDGRRDQKEIVALLEGRFAAGKVRAAIAALSEKGYVVSGEHGMERNRAAYWSSLGASPCWAEQRLAISRVAVAGDDGRLIRRLEASGARVDDAASGLTVIVCGSYLEQRLEEVNRRQLEAGAPWMLVRPKGIEPLFGPVFWGDQAGPCLTCLTSRMRNH